MTDDQFLACLRDAERCMDRTRSHRDALNQLDRATRGRVDDRDQRRALDEVLRELSRGSARKLDETIDAIQSYLQQESRTTLRGREIDKMIRYAENYGADSATIHRLKQEETAAMMASYLNDGPFTNIAKQACTKLAAMLNETTQPMTSTELQVALDAALKTEAAAAAAKAKADDIQYHVDLAAATTVLLGSIQSPKSPVRGDLLARFRKELAPLAQHFGVKIVMVGDRSGALLVQR